MAGEMKLQTFWDVDGVRWLEVSEFESYEETPMQYEPSVEIEMAMEQGEYHQKVLANFTPQDALKIAHIIRKQAKLALREEWRRQEL